MSLLPLPKENSSALIGHLNDAPSMHALTQGIHNTIDAFVEKYQRKPSILLVGHQCGVLASICANKGSHVTIVAPHSAELLMAETYLKSKHPPDPFEVIRKHAVQLPANMGKDMLVMDLFGGFLNSQGAAIIAWDLFSRDVVRTHPDNMRYCVPKNGIMTARLYWCPALSASTIYRNDAHDIGIEPELAHRKWFQEDHLPGGLAGAQPISERVQICTEEYGADNTDAQRVVSYPKFIVLQPTVAPPISECVLAIEWVVSLDDEGKYLMGTSIGMARDLSIKEQWARSAAWPRPCMTLSSFSDTIDASFTCKVDYKVNGSVMLTKVEQVTQAELMEEHFIPDKKLKTIASTTFAKVAVQ